MPQVTSNVRFQIQRSSTSEPMTWETTRGNTYKQALIEDELVTAAKFGNYSYFINDELVDASYMNRQVQDGDVIRLQTRNYDSGVIAA